MLIINLFIDSGCSEIVPMTQNCHFCLKQMPTLTSWHFYIIDFNDYFAGTSVAGFASLGVVAGAGTSVFAGAGAESSSILTSLIVP